MSRRDLWEQVDADLYLLLGVSPQADSEQIQLAWRSTAKRLHPDRGGSVTDFQNAEIAYQVLSDPLERGRYDRMRRQSAGQYASTPSAPRYAYTYSGSHSGASSNAQQSQTPYFQPDSPDPYGDARNRPPRPPRNPWLVALAIIVGIIVVIAAVALALVTFLVLFVVGALFVGRGLSGRNRADQTSG